MSGRIDSRLDTVTGLWANLAGSPVTKTAGDGNVVGKRAKAAVVFYRHQVERRA